jgi:hypothetical protein
MIAGADPDITRILAPILAREREIGRNIQETIKICEAEYKTALDDLITLRFLTPRLLTRQDYVDGISGGEINAFFRGVATEINEFVMDCALLLCGFDSKEQPFIISLERPGIATNYSVNGFHAIGSGWEKAISRLLYSEYKRTNPVERILYDCFDAKAFAEMNSSVGYDWDVKIVTAGKVWSVSPLMKKLIERVWVKYNRSPFDKREKDDEKPPPRDWDTELNAYFSRMTNRIPRGKVRTLMANGKLIEQDMPEDAKRMLKQAQKLKPKQSKRPGARKSRPK